MELSPIFTKGKYRVYCQYIMNTRMQDIKAEGITIPRNSLIVMEPSRMADEALAQMTRRRMGKVFASDKEAKKLWD